MRKAALILGSDSGLPVAQKAIDTLAQFDIPLEVHMLSAHRCPEQTAALARGAREAGAGVILAAAGKAAHLAANTTLPVIGIPIKSSLDGVDALLSTVQMPSGIPVATVGIDGAVNAALLCAQILALSDASLTEKPERARREATEAALSKNAALEAKYNRDKKVRKRKEDGHGEKAALHREDQKRLRAGKRQLSAAL